MARVTINTDLKNITDGASSTTSASLDGVPFKTSTIISSRVFTKKANNTYTIEPYVSFVKTNNPNHYTYTRVHDDDAGTTTFTVKYRHALKPPKTDVIEFFGEAKTSIAASTTKIYSYKINEGFISYQGASRVLTIYGDPHVALKLDVLKVPKRYSGYWGQKVSLINGEQTVLIGPDGKYQTTIHFPSTTLLTNYDIILTEINSGSFVDTLPSPRTIRLTQYPKCEVRFTISGTIDGTGTTVLPSTTVYKYFGDVNSTLRKDFKWIVTKTVNLAEKLDINLMSLGGLDQQSTTLADTDDSGEGDGEYLQTTTTGGNLNLTINNTPSPKTATIEGTLEIQFGYNSGGHTNIPLDVNNILKNA